MNHHLLDCNVIVREPNRTSVQLAENREGGTEHWGKAQVTGMIDKLKSSRAGRGGLPHVTTQTFLLTSKYPS